MYKALDEAHAVCTGFYHQARGSLRGSRKKRAGTFTHSETEVVNIDPVSYLDRPEGPRTQGNSEGSKYMEIPK